MVNTHMKVRTPVLKKVKKFKIPVTELILLKNNFHNYTKMTFPNSSPCAAFVCL